MKKIKFLLLSVAALMSFTQCNESTSENHLEKADSRGKTISALLNNDAYMKQVIDSMQTKHSDVLLANVFVMAKSDKQMPEMMMDKMTAMCKMDTSMTKMVVTKTMKMLDDSKFDCCTTGKMMMGDAMAMNHGDQSDCCKNGKMMTGKTGEMTAVDKLTCCKMSMSKSATKAK